MTNVPVMADYYKVGSVDGKKPAGQWLARLAYERRRVGNEGTPEDFFEAVEILFEEDAALWLNSCSRYRRMVDGRDKATKEDVEEFKIAFQAEFPARKLNVQEEGNVRSGSILRAYYGRSQELLRISHGRDAPEKGASLLAPIEAVVLSNIIAAFLGGLVDDSIRSTVLARPNILSESLRGAYNAAEEAKSTIEKLNNMERIREERKKLEIFRSHYRQQYQRPFDASRVL
ncbi:hypothetical protein GcC1_016038 [Golovinomyces cichoracearum]|uniref:Retrotransposon gag domain-containing protein n=1 Tax=Golovinomyces cichoracearum TaxID=62708 RepID=A0A420J670_9PEZI|nr:hypothetical protein GcC1_016038 [Golovinomyces cichoracearum]